MTKPMSLTGFAQRVEYIKAHRKDKKHSESAAVARKLSRQLREVLCDEQDNLNRWLERRPCIIRSLWEEGREQEVMIRKDCRYNNKGEQNEFTERNHFASLPQLCGIVEHIGDLGIDILVSSCLISSVRTDSEVRISRLQGLRD